MLPMIYLQFIRITGLGDQCIGIGKDGLPCITSPIKGNTAIGLNATLPAGNVGGAPSNMNNMPTPLSNSMSANNVLSSSVDYKCLSSNSQFIVSKMCAPGVNNQGFKDNVAWNLKTFSNFLDLYPNARNQFEKIISNYGIMRPESGPVITSTTNFTGGYGMALPDPTHLVNTVEESLAIQYSFGEYVRTLLETLKKYLSRSSILLAETAKDIKSKYQQLKSAFERYRRETSPNFKDTLSKHIIDLKRETEEAIGVFEEVLDWQQKVTKNMAASL